MKTNYHQLRTSLLAVIVLTLLASAYPVHAIYMNFDSVDASGGDVYATSYLASFGVTLTNVIADGIAAPDSVLIGSSQRWYGGAMCTASSLPNCLIQNAWATQSESYTLNFSTPLQSLSFTRCAYTTWGGAATPGWTATAYIGTTAIGSVGSPNINQDYASPAHTYSFSGAGITSLTITGYPGDSHGGGFGGAACGSAPLDDFYMTVPEPATLLLLSLGGLILRRRK